MKKTCALLALLCVLVCTACPVFADEVASQHKPVTIWPVQLQIPQTPLQTL